MQALTRSIVVWMAVLVASLSLMLFVTPALEVSAQCDASNATTIQSGLNCVQGKLSAGEQRTLNDVIEAVVNTLLFVVGVISVIMLIVGGVRYVISGGNQSQVEGARNTILYAIVGLVIAFVAWGIVNFVVDALK